MNKQEFIKKYNGHKFKRVIENLKSKEQLKKELLNQLVAQNLSKDLLEFDEKCNCFRIENYSFRIDRRKPNEIGVIQFRSKDYIFKYNDKESFGDIPKAINFNDKGFYITDYYNNKVSYEVIEGVTNDTN